MNRSLTVVGFAAGAALGWLIAFVLAPTQVYCLGTISIGVCTHNRGVWPWVGSAVGAAWGALTAEALRRFRAEHR